MTSVAQERSRSDSSLVAVLKRHRAVICLMLYFGASVGGGRQGEAIPPAEQLGQALAAVALLVLAGIFALRDRAWIVGALAGLSLVAIVLVVVERLNGAGDHARVRAELSELESLLVAGPGPNLTPEQREHHHQLVEDAFARVLDSKNPEAVDAAQLMLLLSKIWAEPRDELVRAGEVVNLERFLHVPTMVRANDFEWNASVAADYHRAALSMLDAMGSLPSELSRRAAAKGLPQEWMRFANEQVLRPRSQIAAAARAHLAAAEAYAKVIEFVERNREIVHLHDDGGWCIQDVELNSACLALYAEIDAAESNMLALVGSP